MKITSRLAPQLLKTAKRYIKFRTRLYVTFQLPNAENIKSSVSLPLNYLEEMMEIE